MIPLVGLFRWFQIRDWNVSTLDDGKTMFTFHLYMTISSKKITSAATPLQDRSAIADCFQHDLAAEVIRSWKWPNKKWFTYHIRCFFCDIFGMSKSSLHPVTSEHYKVGIREISLTSGHYHLRLATRSKLSICINDSKAWRSQVLLLQSCLHSCKNIWGSIWTNDLCYDFEIYIYIMCV